MLFSASVLRLVGAFAASKDAACSAASSTSSNTLATVLRASQMARMGAGDLTRARSGAGHVPVAGELAGHIGMMGGVNRHETLALAQIWCS